MVEGVTFHLYGTSLSGIAVDEYLSLIHIPEPTRQAEISYAVFCLKKKKHKNSQYASERHIKPNTPKSQGS